ncbi:MAG TPA: efflux RND transporter periplasmic adaptor subunit [Saprospiraceae bacterium]|nr:efflux RND transporter periplasmic adaptor subunit [Saprospiraceae bacterium]
MRYLIIMMMLVLAACGSKKESVDSKDLGSLKTALAAKQKQMDQLKMEMTTIQEKINKLDTTNTRKKMLVSLETLKTGLFTHTIDVQGNVTGDELLNVSPQMPAIYAKIYAKKGMNVTKGQLLALMDDNVLRQGVEELKSNIQFAQTLYDKQKTLWDQKIGSEVQYLSAKNNLDALKKKMATMNQQLSMYRLTSPINGVVDDVIAKEGEMGSPGFPSIKVFNLKALKLVAHPAESYVDKINTGNDVEVFFPDLNKSYHSKVKTIGKMIDNLNRTFTVDIALPNSSDIRPNMMAISKIIDYQNPKAIVIPINIIVNPDTDPFIYVAEEQGGLMKAMKRKIKLGHTYKNDVEIVSGLKPGEKIITIGYQDLNDGDAISLSN